MGHFSQTCAISRLPITGGDPIRVIFLTRHPYNEGRFGDEWILRTPPIRAEYNDYGDIENIHPEDAGIVASIRELFDRDLVEMPMGENQCHDVEVRRGMSFEKLRETLWENRLRVRYRIFGGGTRVKVPKGVPTWRRLEKLLARAEAKGVIPGGSLVDRIAYGMVRVRYSRWGSGVKSDDKPEWSRKVREFLSTRYRVTDRYEGGPKRLAESRAAHPEDENAGIWDLWFEVAPKDGEYPPVNLHDQARRESLMASMDHFRGLKDRDATHEVRWCFVREEVWQAVLAMGGPDYTWWGKSPTVESETAKLQKIVDLTRAEVSGKFPEEPPPGLDSHMELYWKTFRGKNNHYLIQQVMRLAFRDDTPGGTVAIDHFSDFLEKVTSETPEAEITAFVRAMAELNVVRYLCRSACIILGPTFGGPQDGAWSIQLRMADVLRQTVGKVVEERVSEWDDESRNNLYRDAGVTAPYRKPWSEDDEGTDEPDEPEDTAETEPTP